MLRAMCKSCLYCLETVYWNCCEKKFCFDKELAAFKFDDTDPDFSHAYVNNGASLDSVVTVQPVNNNNNNNNNNNGVRNNNIQRRNGAVAGRELCEIPINADKILEVFSKSMIFRGEPFETLLKKPDPLDELETKSEPDYLEKPSRTKVYFEDEINSPITDFEIMFKDELLGMDKPGIFMIEEEEEVDGLTMNVNLRKPGHDLIKPSSITIKEEAKITSPNPIYEYDPNKFVSVSTLSIPKSEKVKSILRINRELPRSESAKSLPRFDVGSKPLKLKRVESLKNMESMNINKVLSRVPVRSASFLNLPQNLQLEAKTLKKSDSAFAIRGSADSELSLVSRMPDTPIIKSANLPKFFAEGPMEEYKQETTLQSIMVKDSLKLTENDYSMPRYYGVLPSEPPAIHESKSMPDLRVSSISKGSRRLLKLRSKLKPLVIKKGADDQV